MILAAFTMATTFLIENAPFNFCIPEKLKDEAQRKRRRNEALISKKRYVACLVSNIVLSFKEKVYDDDEDDDKEHEGNVNESSTVCDNLQTTVNSQLNLYVQIINIEK
jgi:hypothetical protein